MGPAPPPARPGIIGTAGHVDHGKTRLVRALTGIDTDRLPEEKRRGISIDLGFADLTLPSGRGAAIVDVPGHERFIRNMVAGASGIDLALLVVAADEGVMPQTREHFAIALLLRVPAAVVALTKTDLVAPDWLALAEEDVRGLLSGTPHAAAPIVAVSATTGAGLGPLAAALDKGLAGAEAHQDRGFARLPVDRVFTVPGFGTVVTGTLTSGTISVEDHLALLPAGTAVRVRGLQIHGRAVARASAGQRVACNLAGVDRSDVRRGDVVAAPGSLLAQSLLAVRLQVLHGGNDPLRQGQRLHVHLGTAEALCRLTLLEGDELAPGEAAFALLRMESALAAGRGDRFIVRSYSPVATVGGGVVVEVGRRFRRRSGSDLAQLRVAERGDPRDLLLAALAGAAALALPAAAAAAGLPEAEAGRAAEELLGAGRLIALGGAGTGVADAPGLVTPDGMRHLGAEVRQALRAYHDRHPLRAGMPREELRRAALGRLDLRAASAALTRMAEEGGVRAAGDRIALPDHRGDLPPDLAAIADRLVAAIEAAGLQPPAVASALTEAGFAGDEALRGEFLAHLTAAGRLARADPSLYFGAQAVAGAVQRVRAHLRSHGTITVAELRDLLGVTRRHAVPLAEYLDAARVTRREGDVRRLA